MITKMATAFKFDNGAGHFISNCFPVRNSHKNDDESGAWILAHKNEQRRRFKAVLCANPKTFEEIRQERKRLEKTATDFTLTSTLDNNNYNDNDVVNLLDGFFLLKHCCVEDPTDLCSVNISDCRLNAVKEEDLILFDSVVYVNAADNELKMEQLNGFKMMRELEMPLNNLHDIKIDNTNFVQLQVLDVSYNNLTQNDILSLGMLTNLIVLHLSSNNLQTLPMDMSLPYNIGESSFPRFERLQVLLLDDNCFSTMEVFGPLAGLRNLQELDLSKNRFQFIPHLLISDGRHITMDSLKRKTSGKSNENIENNQSQYSDNETDLKNMQLPPFPNVVILNMSFNLIIKEEGLMPLAAWPSLCQLLIHGNPLVTQHSGDPPKLKKLLSGRRLTNVDIQLIRKEPKPIPKPIVEIQLNKERQVSSKIRKIRKVPVDELLAIEAPTPPSNYIKLPPISTSQSINDPEITNSENDEINKSNFFITETEEEKLSESFDKTSDMKPTTTDFNPTSTTTTINASSTINNNNSDDTKTLEKWRDEDIYKLLDLSKEEEEILKANNYDKLPDEKDLTGNVRALNHLLNHPLQLQERKVSLYSKQVPYRPELKPRPPPPIDEDINAVPRIVRLKKKEEILKNIRKSKTYKEANLGDILKEETLAKDFPNAAKLLRKIEKRYSKVKVDVMDQANQLRNMIKQTIENVEK